MRSSIRPIHARRGFTIALVLLCIMIEARPAAATSDSKPRSVRGHAEVFIGAREMNLSAWSPVRSQLLIGMAGGFGRHPSKLLLDAGFTFSFASHNGYPAREGSGDVVSLFAGAGRTWTSSSSPWGAYAGAGPEFAYATFDSLGGAKSESRGSIAGYARGGVGWASRAGWTFGIDLRYTLAPRVTLQGRDRGLTGESAALSLTRFR